MLNIQESRKVIHIFLSSLVSFLAGCVQVSKYHGGAYKIMTLYRLKRNRFRVNVKLFAQAFNNACSIPLTQLLNHASRETQYLFKF